MVQTKSRHHKNENTHHFLTLAERLSNLNVDVVKRINRNNLKPEETETYFHQTLTKWFDLNYSAVFNEFNSKLRNKCHSLAQLIYHKDALADILIEYIGKADPLSLQPILDLTAQFARDLQVDFYPFFPRIFHAIVGLLDTQDTDVLEWSFQTLSYLFKFLWRYMLKDLESVYNLYSPLLNESRKAYIRNFSVESFAFLMRKITDKNQLFDFLLNRLIKKPDELDGIGRLMFEMFRGIKHQFNACTEQSLGILLEKIHGFNQQENELVLSCIGKTLEAMAEFTKKEHSSLVWRCFYKSIDKNLNNQAKLTDLLRLMYLFLKSKDCYLIDNLDALTENLSKVGKLDLNRPETKLQLTESLMKICHVLLLSENVKFAIEKANIIPNMIYQPKYDPDQVFDLTRKLFPYEQFETLILPNVISYFDAQTINNENNKKFLNLTVEYLVRHKKIINSELVEDLKTGQSALNFVEKFSQVKDLSQLTRLFSEKKFTGLKLYSSLEKFLSQNAQFYLESKENHNELILAETLLLIPIVFPTSKHLNELVDRINDQLVRNLNRLSSDQNWEKFESESFLLSLSHWTYTISNRCESVETRVKHLVELISKVGEHGKTMNNLFRALNYSIVLSNDKRNLRPILKDVITVVKSHLSSPYHEIRLNSLNLLDYYFQPEMEAIERIKLDDDEELNLFEICTKAEMTRASLEEYRRKLFYIQRLDTNVCSKYFQVEQLKDVPLRYFFGLLFENFKLLWDSIVTLIQNYANHMKMNEFWNVFFEYFSQLTEKIENIPKSLKQVELTEDSLLDLELLKSVFSENNHNIDYMNNRYLLCQAMKGFTSICESRTKQLVPIFFRFMNNEYYLEENRLLSTAYDDITQKFAERQANQKSAKEKFFSKKLLNKHLCAYLEVFALFTSPKSWHQEENLRNLYLNLLCHQEASVQKLALKCLYTYQYSYLTPYKENLERLLEGKYFRRELVIFSLDAANGVVHSDDRVKLLPILMRLLYGKFHSNETTHTASKDTKSNKRSVIIQFLSQCNEYELNYFFNLIFDCLNTAIDRHANNEKANSSEERFEKNPNELDSTERSKSLANLLKCLDSTSSAIYDLKHTIPFKKILGVLQSLEIVMRKLARQMESFSHRILQMLGFIHKYAITIHEKAQDLKRNENNPIDEYHVNLLKIIRQQVTLRFKQFFEIYDHLNFSQEEYFYIYETFIWPQALRVPNESLKSVSNVLKLMSIWSSHPRYYPLLVVRADNFTQCSSLIAELNDSYAFKRKNMLDILFELIDSQQCSPGVINFVIEMIYNLVSYADFVEESDENEDSFGTKKLPFDVGFIQDEFKTEAKDLNFGTMVLKPYVTSIVSHVERIVINNMSKKTLPPKPLKILARLSGFASNSTQQCEKIIQLLIPYLIKNRKQDEETQLNILSSINHLIRQVKNVDEFICPLSRLFSAIGNRQSRVEICNIFESIKQIDSKYEFISTLVNDLNSWDPKRLEEPDYMRRLDGYKHLNEAIQQWTEFDTKLASILFYNCFFFIKNIGDLALKESSTHCVIQFLKKSASLELNKSDKYLFEANFLAELKSGLKSKVENARHEFIAILVEFIKSFQSIFTTYNDLNLLFDEDIEKDFYENIKHIQMHRRARALKKLQRACAEKQISSESLLNFLMPLVRSFIDNEMYHKYDYIVEDACKAMGAICSVLAWPKYIKILEFYLKSLVKAPPKATAAAANAKNEKKNNETESSSGPNQKLVIKIICFILDAFHYDLSLSSQKGFYFSETSQKAVVEKKKEKKMEEGEEQVQEEEEKDGPKKTLVGSAMANKIHATLSQSIIPMLFKCLTKRLKSDGEHKVNKKEDESEQILRVPIALALLKLLVNLPSRTFETHLPGLLFKVCDMLKSRAISVRISTRECLMKMIDALPQKRYYSFVFKELSNALSRGYQAHVLCFTIYEVLKKVESRLVCGDLDASLDTIMASVNLELFTDVSEEKEVKQIVAKTLEAKTVSSYGTLEILAKFVSKNNMLRILKPFKEQLDVCNSKKLLKKIEDALKRVLLGFLANQSLSTVDLMEVAHGLLNDTLDVLKDPGKFKKRNKPSLVNEEDKKEEEKKSNALPKSCLIIPYEPKRGGDKPKVLTRTNQHVIVEFALQLLHNLLKQNRLNEEKDEQKKEDPSKSENTANYKEMLEPYVPIFVDYLDGKYIKVTIITLRCLVTMLRFNLKSIEEKSSVLGTKLFSLLRTFSSASTTSTPSSSGDNFELLMVCYKLIACLIRDCTHFELSDDQLQTLLHCAERNLFDTHKQASTFNLLKAIVSRRFESDDLGEIMGRVMKLSIQAESPPVRAQSRQTVMSYLIAYAMGAGRERDEKKFAKIVEFYVVQLNYEYENGRESAIEMLATMFNTFPTEKLNEHCAMFFLPLAVQLHNDESSKCKKLAWMALKSLLEKIDIEHQDALFQITASLFKDSEKPLHKRIAALLTKIFVEVEKQQFERRLDTVLEILSSEIDSKNYESEIENNTSTLINEKFYDQYLFNLLTLFMKILTECKLIENKKHLSVINKIFDQVKIYLLHEHLWVRLVSCQLFGHLFAAQPIEELIGNKKSGYFSFSTKNKYEKIRDLIDSFCVQMKSPVLDTELAEQIVKNLAFMAKVINRNDEEFSSMETTHLDHDLNMEWLIKKVIREAKYELVNKPKETIKRIHIFKWIAAVVHELGKEKINNYLGLLMGVLQREAVIEQNDENLKRLAHEVLEFIKQIIGTEEYSLLLAKSNKRRVENKEERKRKIAQTAILDPQLAAMKKIRKMQKKKDAKKRKIESNKNQIMNGSGGKKRKLMTKEKDDF